MGNNTLNGGAGNDTLTASGLYTNNLISGGDGNNTLNGGAGNDTLTASSLYTNNLLSGGDGNDSFDLSGSSGKNTLNGGAGDDTLSANGSYGNNLLLGAMAMTVSIGGVVLIPLLSIVATKVLIVFMTSTLLLT
ncbi:calcium-binding protein [Nostoc sp.]|uniref:calcium-binding protein n=1 Tax=Nostoc sp. TaxID=1180 RepID=UPI003FA5C023